MGEQNTLSSSGIAGLIDNFIKVYEDLGDPSEEDITQIESHLGPLMGDDRPDKIAGNLVFFRLSLLLYGEQKLTMTELSEKLRIEKYSATRLVSWWVEKGLVERLNDPNDRRIVRVALTEKGKRFHETIENIVLQRVQKVMQWLTDEELAGLIKIFRKLAAKTST